MRSSAVDAIRHSLHDFGYVKPNLAEFRIVRSRIEVRSNVIISLGRMSEDIPYFVGAFYG